MNSLGRAGKLFSLSVLTIAAPRTLAVKPRCQPTLWFLSPPRPYRPPSPHRPRSPHMRKPPTKGGLIGAKNRILLEERIRLGQALVHLVPVDYVPPSLQVIRTPILILQVISVLPDIIAQDGKFAVGDRV